MANADLSRLINSDEVQSVVNAPKVGTAPRDIKRNPLRVPAVMDELNPAAAAARKRAGEKQAAAVKAKAELLAAKRAGKAKPAPKDKAVEAGKKAFYKTMVADDS